MYMESISGIKTRKQAASAAQTAKVSGQTATPKAAEAKKIESTDGVVNVEIAKESDESVTLSIQTDKQLVDEQKNGNDDKLKKVVEQAISALPHSDAKFGVHEKTNRITIKLVDRDTQEVIKEIPPEKTLDMLAKGMEIAGVLVDERL